MRTRQSLTRLVAWSRMLTCQKPKQSLLAKRRMTTRTERAESKPSDEATGHDDEEASSQGSAKDSQTPRIYSPTKRQPHSSAPKHLTEDLGGGNGTRLVVDREAWTESVPVYGTVEVSICNICGIDITGNTSAHAKEHMKAGEGSGHHSETRQIITGHNTVSHPEEGHWETKVVGGHWG